MLAIVNPVMAIFTPDFTRGIKLLKEVIVSGLSGNRLQVNQKMSWDHAFRLWKQATKSKKSASPVICIGFSFNYKQTRNISQLGMIHCLLFNHVMDLILI